MFGDKRSGHNALSNPIKRSPETYIRIRKHTVTTPSHAIR